MGIALGMIARLLPGVRPGGVFQHSVPAALRIHDLRNFGNPPTDFAHRLYQKTSVMMRGMARPATHPIKKVVGFDPELIERVRNYRFRQRISTENEAIRRLIKAGLRAERSRRPRKSNAT